MLHESARRKRVNRLVAWGHWFALANILLAIVIAAAFVMASPAPGTFLGSFYLLSNWLGHVAFLIFLGFVLFVLPLCYLDVSERKVKALASFLAATGLALLAFDALLFNRTGFHLSFTSASLVKREAEVQLLHLSPLQYALFFFYFVAWLGFQLTMANALWKRLDRFTNKKAGRVAVSIFVAAFVCSHVIHVWADATLYQPIIKQDNMFPLSYPATAKTTLSKYGMLDLSTYNERRQLQFDPAIHALNYPSSAVYCSVNNNKSVSLLVQTDHAALFEPHLFDMRVLEDFYVTASTEEGLVVSTLYAVPEIYQQSIGYQTPLVVDLLNAYAARVKIETSLDLDNALRQAVTQASSDSPVVNLEIIFAPAATINALMTPDYASNRDIYIASGFGNVEKNGKGRLITNQALVETTASIEDLIPTILSSLGCLAPPAYYSTGQNLFNPSRDWLVSTSGERVLVFYQGKRTELQSDGSFVTLDSETERPVNEDLNMDVLTRAIKQLTAFSTQK